MGFGVNLRDVNVSGRADSGATVSPNTYASGSGVGSITNNIATGGSTAASGLASIPTWAWILAGVAAVVFLWRKMRK